MELAMVASPRKRPMSQLIGEAGDRIFKFRILLPNGCTTAITIQEPAEEMDIRDFVSFIKQEYEHAVRRISDLKRPIKWDGQIYLEDMSEKLIRKRICFRQFKPNKLNLLRLHVRGFFFLFFLFKKKIKKNFVHSPYTLLAIVWP